MAAQGRPREGLMVLSAFDAEGCVDPEGFVD